jgi:hypothetical protein
MASYDLTCHHFHDGRFIYVFNRSRKGMNADSMNHPLTLASGLRASAWNEEGRDTSLSSRQTSLEFEVGHHHFDWLGSTSLEIWLDNLLNLDVLYYGLVDAL